MDAVIFPETAEVTFIEANETYYILLTTKEKG